jgi:bifunctional DNA-binding transcriptional regulator/antitoxin component of YhaV-PrlF toxin-antitoxin module
MQSINVKLDPEGGFILPTEFYEVLVVKPGDPVFVSVEEDGIYFRTGLQMARLTQSAKDKRLFNLLGID